jgi:hypothetical protein
MCQNMPAFGWPEFELVGVGFGGQGRHVVSLESTEPPKMYLSPFSPSAERPPIAIGGSGAGTLRLTKQSLIRVFLQNNFVPYVPQSADMAAEAATPRQTGKRANQA